MEFPLLISNCPALILVVFLLASAQTLRTSSLVDTPTSSGDLSLGYAHKLPSQFQTEASSSFLSSPTTPTSSQSPNSQKSRRKQTLVEKAEDERLLEQFPILISEPASNRERGQTPSPELSWADRQKIWT